MSRHTKTIEQRAEAIVEREIVSLQSQHTAKYGFNYPYFDYFREWVNLYNQVIRELAEQEQQA